MQYGRVLSGASYRGSEGQHMPEADVLMLAVALRDSLRLSDAMRDLLTGTARAQADVASQDFAASVPDVVRLRDVLEHIDEYEGGRGRRQLQARAAGDAGPPSWLSMTFEVGREITLVIEGADSSPISLPLLRACTESMTLASKTIAAALQFSSDPGDEE
jgi:hypothetical protein